MPPNGYTLWYSGLRQGGTSSAFSRLKGPLNRPVRPYQMRVGHAGWPAQYSPAAATLSKLCLVRAAGDRHARTAQRLMDLANLFEHGVSSPDQPAGPPLLPEKQESPQEPHAFVQSQPTVESTRAARVEG